MLTFPQIETVGSQHARQDGIAAAAPRYLVPMEVAKKIGVLDADFEAVYYFRGRGPKERILGLVAGRSITERLELGAEIYDDRPYDATTPGGFQVPSPGGKIDGGASLGQYRRITK
jgi:hypothetical protein